MYIIVLMIEVNCVQNMYSSDRQKFVATVVSLQLASCDSGRSFAFAILVRLQYRVLCLLCKILILLQSAFHGTDPC